MARLSPHIRLIGFVLIAANGAAHAQSIEPTTAERKFDYLGERYAPASNVQTAAFVGTPTQRAPAPLPPPPPATPAPTIIPPNNGPSIYPSPSSPSSYPSQTQIGSPPSDAWCLPPAAPCRTSSWTATLETIITQADVNRFAFGAWPNDHDVAGRLILDYEDLTGLGLRLRFWGFNQDVAAFSTDVELSASSANFDMYKRLLIDETELVLGGGAAGGSLEFKIPDDGEWGFNDGGVTMFAEGFQPLLQFPKIDIGMVGRARMSLLAGDWDDTTDFVGVSTFGVPAVTDHDTMSVVELAWGFELRRRFGKHDDHHWFAAAIIEHQRWESDWMATFAGSAVGFTGTNFSLG